MWSAVQLQKELTSRGMPFDPASSKSELAAIYCSSLAAVTALPGAEWEEQNQQEGGASSSTAASQHQRKLMDQLHATKTALRTANEKLAIGTPLGTAPCNL